MNQLLAVAVGGAFGAVGRYWVMGRIGHWLGADFPYGTLTVNLIGSFLMGMLVELVALVWTPGPELRAMLSVGFLGAFTTFSTFSLDVVVLVERGALAATALYVAASLVLSVAALFGGLQLVRSVLT